MELIPIQHLSLGGIAKQLALGALNPSEVLQHFLSIVKQQNPSLNAIIHVDEESLVKKAKTFDHHFQMISKDSKPFPPYLGIPIPIKELAEVQDHPTSYASRAFEGFRPNYTRAAIQQLFDAGFYQFGSTTSSEFGASCFTESLANGITRNPWNTGLSPGGSSGGAAVAVASGMAPVAHGSDGGGSLRIPAAWCGVIGFKPSRGLISAGPLYTWSLLATQGVITRNIEDQALMLDLWNQPDTSSWQPFVKKNFHSELYKLAQNGSRLRVGICMESPLGKPVHPEYKNCLRAVAAHLSLLGHHVKDYTPPWGSSDAFIDFFQTLWAALIASIPVGIEKFEAANQLMWRKSRSQSAFDLMKAQNDAQTFSRRMTEAFQNEIDILLTPTMALPAPIAGSSLSLGQTDPEKLIETCYEHTPFTPWVNVTGQPAISIPLGRSSTQMPIGIQIIGAPFQDSLVLQLAQELEETLGYPDAEGKRCALAPISIHRA